MPESIAKRVSALYGSRWHRGYVKSKVRTDPLYGAVFEELKDENLPLLDVGCGLGVLAFYLRARGLTFPISAIDYDRKKVDAANAAAEAGGFDDLEFDHGDARESLPQFTGNVTILDILQFFSQAEQASLLTAAATSLPPGGKLVIRSGLKDRSLRFKITHAGDIFARASFWMKAAPTEYPTRESIAATLEGAGLVGAFRPLWGKTPFNNYLAVFRKEG